MYLCLCNPFTDKDLKKTLAETEGKSSVSGAYKACSGGKKPQCCTCMKNIKAMVQAHQSEAGFA